ncbi:MAG TPA: alkaline phosphatase family protein [Planctomycetota bacterium]|nr:alkaline phosphatase family protein [Planctomycetota bacterium]
MRPSCQRRRCRGVAALALPLLLLPQTPSPARDEPPPLVVVCVFDQMRADYLERFAPVFGDGGIRRLLAEGADFTSCEYPYAGTETGPGHTTIGTGVLPAVHGIVANHFFDREAGRRTYCVEDRDSPLVGAKGEVEGKGRSARWIAADTLGDRLRRESPASRVYAVSWKDRAAIPLGGKLANSVLWFSPEAGGFVSSRAWPSAIPPWLAEFQDAHALARLPSSWDRSLPLEAYARCSPDDSAWEHASSKLGRVFPHPIRSWAAVGRTPVGLRMLTDLAIEIVDREKLGRGPASDLLCVSWSATDYAGHDYGPSSQEALDVYACADRELARFLAKLDSAVGAGRYVVALTSDHGVAEVLEPRGETTHRIHDVDKELVPGLSKEIGKELSSDRHWIATVAECDIALDRDTLRASGVELDRAATELRDVLRRHPAVEAAYTASELAGEKPAARGPYVDLFRASMHPGRYGDVFFVLRDGWTIGDDAASHGTPHECDRHVPLLVRGPGVRPGRVDAPVTPADLAPTLAAWLRLPPRPGEEERRLPFSKTVSAAAATSSRAR